ncbi:MAG TPA: flagellar assembly protein FliW [Acidimicrobiales bacterium]|nr:flagellar assembly protein FliW [Acidimicrobiales bacterium]
MSAVSTDPEAVVQAGVAEGGRAPVPSASPEERSLHFPAGIPGFAAAKHFSLRPWGDSPTPFQVLECREVPRLCFVAVDPVLFFPDYAPEVGAEAYRALDMQRSDPVDVLVILSLHSRPEETTANLLGPVVINPASGRALQAVLSGSGFDPQTPLFRRA